MRITFYGAAQEVTGSMHLLEVNGQRILLECGLFQGPRAETYARNLNFPFEAASIDTMVLSHAHIDHSGNLPNLVKQGYHGDDLVYGGDAESVHLYADGLRLYPRDGCGILEPAAGTARGTAGGAAVYARRCPGLSGAIRRHRAAPAHDHRRRRAADLSTMRGISWARRMWCWRSTTTTRASSAGWSLAAISGARPARCCPHRSRWARRIS